MYESNKCKCLKWKKPTKIQPYFTSNEVFFKVSHLFPVELSIWFKPDGSKTKLNAVEKKDDSILVTPSWNEMISWH